MGKGYLRLARASLDSHLKRRMREWSTVDVDADRCRETARVYQDLAERLFAEANELKEALGSGDGAAHDLAMDCVSEIEWCGCLVEDAAECLALGASEEFKDSVRAALSKVA